MEKIMKALMKAGVIFVEENGDGPGVRLRKKKQPKWQPIPTTLITGWWQRSRPSLMVGDWTMLPACQAITAENSGFETHSSMANGNFRSHLSAFAQLKLVPLSRREDECCTSLLRAMGRGWGWGRGGNDENDFGLHRGLLGKCRGRLCFHHHGAHPGHRREKLAVTLMYDDTYTFDPKPDLSKFKVGERVLVTFTGKNQASAIEKTAP
jgi:hypothetical protein